MSKNGFSSQFFTHKRCVITGASSGVGRLLALKLARLGARLILIARRQELLAQVQSACRDVSTHKEIYYFSADTSNADQSRQAIAFTQEKMGGIDLLVANAGRSMHLRIEDSQEEVYKKMFTSNFYTAVNIILPALEILRENRATLVAVTSIQSLIGVPCHGAYVASKHAIAGFLETLELEEPKIQIVELLTGWISGTDIRINSVKSTENIVPQRKEHIQRHPYSTIDAEEAVGAMIEGITKKTRLVFRPKFWKNILFVKYSMRRFLFNLIKNRQSFDSQ